MEKKSKKWVSWSIGFFIALVVYTVIALIIFVPILSSESEKQLIFKPVGFVPILSSESEEQFILNPIGKVHKTEESTKLILKKEYAPALKGLDKNSHVWVIWWFDRNDTVEKRSILQVHPCGNNENPLTGVFACRSPVRPNLIALSLCRILSVENNIVELEKIDAFDETPILDLKPYIPGYDSTDDAVTPRWKR